MFRHLQCELGSSKLDEDTAMHIYLHGLKHHIGTDVFRQRPSTFEDLVLLAERCDQAYMVFRNNNNSNNNNQRNNSNNNNNNNRNNSHKNNRPSYPRG